MHVSEPDVAHYRVSCEIGEETGITMRVMAKVAWPHDLLVTLAGTFEDCSTVAVFPVEEIAAAVQLASAVLVVLAVAEITWAARTCSK